MVKRVDPFILGDYFHIFNRGVNRSYIFFEEENVHFFLRRLRKYVVGRTAKLIAYVLMPNHYHLLLQICDKQFSQSMQRISISYTKAINERYGRSGPLFEGAFKARRVTGDEDLLNLSRYIHLNPKMAGLVERPEDWEFSSLGDYLGKNKQDFLDKKTLLQYFQLNGEKDYSGAIERYKKFIETEGPNFFETDWIID